MINEQEKETKTTDGVKQQIKYSEINKEQIKKIK